MMIDHMQLIISTDRTLNRITEVLGETGNHRHAHGRVLAVLTQGFRLIAIAEMFEKWLVGCCC